MSGSESDWSDGCPELEADDEAVTKSLFSSFRGTAEECLADDKTKFGWTLADLEIRQYDYIKLINYCRKQKYESAPDRGDILNKLRSEWDLDEFYRPQIEDDPFLMYEWEKEAPVSIN